VQLAKRRFAARRAACGLVPSGFVSQAANLRFESRLVVDHVCPHGPHAISIRGSMLIASLRLLKDSGHYPTYEAMLPSEHRDAMVGALAGSWLPIELWRVHFDTVDGLNLSDTQLSRMGGVVGARILDSLFGTLVRAARQAGTEAGIWLGFRQADRIWTRIFQGGGVVVIQTGPKDAIVEVSGLPVASSRFFRVAFSAFVRGAMMLVAKSCFVKPVVSRNPRPDSLAVSVSWV
jgi:hypothetical protein